MRIQKFTPAAVVLAAMSVPAMAQDAPTTPEADETATVSATLTAEQQVMLDGWPADQQAQFKAWSADTQAYFWSLTPERQELFWRLKDGDKVKLAGMTADQQAQAWTQIEQMAAAAPAPTPAPDATAEPAPDDTAVPEGSPVEPEADPTADPM